MEVTIMVIVAIIAVAAVITMLIKKMDIKISLFAIGIILCIIAVIMGKPLALEGFTSTGLKALDPFEVVGQQFTATLTLAGFIILILGGYTAYMSKIGANDVTVSIFAKPIGHVKSKYILVPVVFLIGNLLSLVVPSASNLAIILLATLYPILRKAGMSLMSAAAVIATSATIMPTPLGSDNVAIAAQLAKTTYFHGLSAADYVFHYHVLVSIPILLIMAVTHYFWQRHCDKADAAKGVLAEEVDLAEVKTVKGGRLYKTVYAILPLLPIVLLLIFFIVTTATGVKITFDVALAAIISFIIAILCELIRSRDGKATLKDTDSFFTGMGNAMPIVALLVAASVFVIGLQSIGLINELQKAMTGMHGSGYGFVLPLILLGLTALIVLLSGSGTALTFAMIPLMVPLATAAGINVLAVSVPLGLGGNLMRAVSPVSAVVMIVAGSVHRPPLEIVKRTSVPMIVGLVCMFIISMIIFLPMGVVK